MRMERVSNNQIKCYLNQNDLASRELKFSEITYGNPKTQNLFQEMMIKASNELDFDMQNVPIMIEIVPVSYDSIMLIITKVEDPSDIDDQFVELQQQDSKPKDMGREIPSKQNKPVHKASSNPTVTKPVFEDLNHLKQTELSDVSFAYQFDSMENVIAAAKELVKYRVSESILYQEGDKFILLIKNYNTTKDMRSVLSGLLAEFGKVYKNNSVTFEYYSEHCDVVLAEDAVKQLARL